MNRSLLRSALRAQRRALGTRERDRLSRAICREVVRAIGPRSRGRRIAAYAALPEEADLSAALSALAQRGARLYLPRIASYRHRRLVFARAGGAGTSNRYGIVEPPRSAPTLRAARLDIVLVPLVGFDRAGTRLGMGGGYYDRAFAFRRRRRAPSRPLLIGIAFACQQVDTLPAADHDIRLDAVITERGLIRTTHGAGFSVIRLLWRRRAITE
ncbi:MAG: 5-formyltetrahydrofolate cyclo-ligase [Steroidobacteraceae bacterium]|nr:5-formyltetrahydrofolate cyclo-ligase [Steroidobacteraceae bacterium]